MKKTSRILKSSMSRELGSLITNLVEVLYSVLGKITEDDYLDKNEKKELVKQLDSCEMLICKLKEHLV